MLEEGGGFSCSSYMATVAPGQDAVFTLRCADGYGRANPSGRLAESWPVRYEDCPSAPFYGKTKDALYLEGVYVGYRYYDKAKKDVRWPFGYGLSYTSFGYSGLKAEAKTVSFFTVSYRGSISGPKLPSLFYLQGYSPETG